MIERVLAARYENHAEEREDHQMFAARDSIADFNRQRQLSPLFTMTSSMHADTGRVTALSTTRSQQCLPHNRSFAATFYSACIHSMYGIDGLALQWFDCSDLIDRRDVNKANCVKAKAKQYKVNASHFKDKIKVIYLNTTA